MTEPRRHMHFEPFRCETETDQYEVVRRLVDHPYWVRLLVASRREVHTGRTELVMLKSAPGSTVEERQRRAEQEVRLGVKSEGPNLERVLGWVRHGDEVYVVVEHDAGCFLATLLDAAVLLKRKVSPAFAAYVTAEVAEALSHLHRLRDTEGRPLGIIHRAVGHMSVRLTEKGRVKLCDMGQAWSAQPEHVTTPRDVLKGAPAYFAPEVLMGYMHPPGEATTPPPLDARSDIFSLGLLLLEMLLGHHPLDKSDVAEPETALQLHERLRTERNSWLGLEELAGRLKRFDPETLGQGDVDIPAALLHIARRAARHAVEERYAAAEEMGNALRVWLELRGGKFGKREARREAARLLRDTADMRQVSGYATLERGVLPTPRDVEGREPV